MMRQVLRQWAGKIDVRDVLEAAGFVLVSVAAWQWSEIAGLATGGVSLIVLATFGGKR